MKKRELDAEKLIEMYMSGVEYSDICGEFGVSVSLLRKRIREYGLPPRKQPLVIDVEMFKVAYNQGLSSSQLAKKFGICRCTVARFVKELRLRENINIMYKMELHAKM